MNSDMTRFAVGFGALLFAASANAYFVRPVVTFGSGTLIDGLIVDGATQNDVGFNDAARQARSDVNLATGEMKLFAAASGPSTSASGQGIMGDTVTFVNGIGTDAYFSFGLDAVLDVDVTIDTFDSPLFSWRVTVGVFERGLVDYTDWFGRSGEALLFNTATDSISDPMADIVGMPINAFVDGTLILPTNRETYDVFYQASLFGGSGSLGQIASFVFDGENTATAGVDVAQGVEVYSGSGVFLGFGADPNAVPVPATIALLSAGWIGFSRRRKRTIAN